MWKIIGSEESCSTLSRIDLADVKDEVISVGSGLNRLRIACISDTHSEEEEVAVPEADLFAFAGDAVNFSHGSRQLSKFHKWISSAKCKDKVFVAGNHDVFLQKNRARVEELLPGVKYLEDAGVSVGPDAGVTVYGAPWTVSRNLFYLSSAFSLPADKIREKWRQVPTGVDILVTHSPPWGVLDVSRNGSHTGSEHLRNEIADRIHPKIHIFGHNHNFHAAQLGTFVNGDKCLFVNASATKSTKPILIDYFF